MKTLEAIQKLCKLGKILSKIICICCIVGFCGCLVGVAAMAVGTTGALKLGGVTLHSLLETSGGVTAGTIWAAIAMGLILCTGEYIVAKMACRYFDHELAAGTPFTEEGANEMLHLGISVIWIPIVATVLAQVACGIIDGLLSGVKAIELMGVDSVALGVMFIFTSLFCRAAAQQLHPQPQLPEEQR